MRLTYVTRTRIASHAAQARQVEAMARALHGQLGDGFMLISGGRSASTDFTHAPLPFDGHDRLRHLSACVAAGRAALQDRNNVIFTRDIAVAWAAVAMGGRAVYEAHREPAGAVATRLVRACARRDRFRMVAISAALANYYQEHYPIPGHRLLVAHDGAFPEDYLPLLAMDKRVIRARLGVPAEGVLVVHTGSLYKGGAALFEDVANVAGSGLHFVHVGGSAPECARWSEYYTSRGFVNLTFRPHQPSEAVRQFQVAADALFYVSTRSSPIYWCTSPLKVFEYMASGTPIIGANLGSVAEVLNETNAFCYDPSDSQSLRQAVADCLSRPEEARRRAQNASRELMQQYSWHERAKRIIAFAAD